MWESKDFQQLDPKKEIYMIDRWLGKRVREWSGKEGRSLIPTSKMLTFMIRKTKKQAYFQIKKIYHQVVGIKWLTNIRMGELI